MSIVVVPPAATPSVTAAPFAGASPASQLPPVDQLPLPPVPVQTPGATGTGESTRLPSTISSTEGSVVSRVKSVRSAAERLPPERSVSELSSPTTPNGLTLIVIGFASVTVESSASDPTARESLPDAVTSKPSDVPPTIDSEVAVVATDALFWSENPPAWTSTAGSVAYAPTPNVPEVIFSIFVMPVMAPAGSSPSDAVITPLLTTYLSPPPVKSPFEALFP